MNHDNTVSTPEEWVKFCSESGFDPQTHSAFLLFMPKDGSHNGSVTVLSVNDFGRTLDHILVLMRLITTQPALKEIVKAYHDILVAEGYLQADKSQSGIVAARAIPPKL